MSQISREPPSIALLNFFLVHIAVANRLKLFLVEFRDFREGDIIEAYNMEEIETSIADVNKEAERKNNDDGAESK